jgi:hypothetical protein
MGSWFLLAQDKVLWLTGGYSKKASDPVKGQDFEQLSDCHLKKQLCPYQWCRLAGINIDLADVTLCSISPLLHVRC